MNRRIGVVATLVVSALAFTGGAMLYSGTAEGEPTKKVVAGPVDSLIRPHSPIIGPKNAPVTIVEFFDPSCEACRAFYPTVKGIVAKYPKDVRLVMRYLPLHPGSAEAIVILEAARVQGKLEPVTAALLEAQPEWHDGKMDGAWAAAEKAGLNVAKARAMPTTDAMAWMEQDPRGAGAHHPSRRCLSRHRPVAWTRRVTGRSAAVEEIFTAHSSMKGDFDRHEKERLTCEN